MRLAARAVRLSTGPLSVDIVTPWLTAALQDRLGGRHQIEVGGTQLERTEEGRAALRLRDVVVRDPDGTVVATAPKAEVGLSGPSLLAGHLQAKRLSLIGATMAVRVERDGELTIFAGAQQRPIATASACEIVNLEICSSLCADQCPKSRGRAEPFSNGSPPVAI